MKLSQLVKVKNDLTNLSVKDIRSAVEELDGKTTVIPNTPLHMDYANDINTVVNILDQVETQLDSIENTILPSLIDKIDKEITERTQDFLSRGYMINGFYGSNSTNVETERNDRQMFMHDEVRAEILVKVRGYTDWRYPTLEIGPGDGAWTEHLVASDPLYIVDVHQEFLDSALSKFNETYKRRVRPYLTGMHARRKDTDLSMLPKDQFGFIFSWNVFNYFPLAHVKEFLNQSINLLRPGGVMFFSFNNCDVPQCAEFAEEGFQSWMTSKMLINACKEAGFEIIDLYTRTEIVSWIEIKKPGTLKTVKGHQVLGEILNR